MAAAKPRKKIQAIKKAGTWLRKKLLPPSSKVPGQMNYPAIAKIRKTQAERKKMLDEIK